MDSIDCDPEARLQDALKECTQDPTATPEELIAIHEISSKVAQDQGRLAAACLHITEAIQLREQLAEEQPGHTGYLHFVLGYLQEEQGLLEDAVGSFQNAIRDLMAAESQFEPKLFMALIHHHLITARLGDTYRQSTTYETLREICLFCTDTESQLHYSATLIAAGTKHFQLGQIDEAHLMIELANNLLDRVVSEEDIERQILNTSKRESKKVLAAIHTHHGEYSEALVHLDQILRDKNLSQLDQGEIACSYAKCLCRTGETFEAEEFLSSYITENAARLDKTSVLNLRLELADLYLSDSKLREAEEILGDLKDFLVDLPAKQKAHYFILAATLATGDKRIGYFEKAVESHGPVTNENRLEVVSSMVYLARSLIEINQLEQAERVLKDAFDLSFPLSDQPNLPHIACIRQLATIEFQGTNDDQALGQLTKAEELLAKVPNGRHTGELARIYFEKANIYGEQNLLERENEALKTGLDLLEKGGEGQSVLFVNAAKKRIEVLIELDQHQAAYLLRGKISPIIKKIEVNSRGRVSFPPNF